PLARTRTACTSHYRLPHPSGALPLPASRTHTLRHARRCAHSAHAVSHAARLLTLLPTSVTAAGVAGWHAFSIAWAGCGPPTCVSVTPVGAWGAVEQALHRSRGRSIQERLRFLIVGPQLAQLFLDVRVTCVDVGDAVHQRL